MGVDENLEHEAGRIADDGPGVVLVVVLAREPRLMPSLPVEYQVVTRTLRLSPAGVRKASVSEESALVEMPCGYHCSSRSS